MRALLKSWSLQINSIKYVVQIILTFMFVLSACNMSSQIVNYVSDGSFEVLNSYSLTTYYNVPKYWQPIDTGKASNYLATLNPPIKNAPGALGYQFPRTGNNYIICTFYCNTCPTYNRREYPRNRLKKPLSAGKVYCAKYYVVNTNNSPLAIDRFGAYFSDSSLDTINYCNSGLTYLTPQVQNASGNIITDTMNWVPITGTFVATGNEKYMVLGNFFSEANTSTMLINPTYSTQLANDVCIDDVSVIELDLPAFAGRDTFMVAGDSVFLGRQPDVGIDEACIWYQLPGNTSIDTVAGLWVKPGVTTSYVVKQDICGYIKYDTVTVYLSAFGVHEIEDITSSLSLYPQPAKDVLNLKLDYPFSKTFDLVIYDSFGQLCRKEEASFDSGKATINITDLASGVYFVTISTKNNGGATKKLVITNE